MASTLTNIVYSILFFLSILLIILPFVFSIKHFAAFNQNQSSKYKAIILLIISVILFFVHPASNYLIFDRVIENDFENSIQKLEQNDLSDKEKDFFINILGTPRISLKENDIERLFFSPGPWYTYSSLDEIVIELKDEKFQRWYIDCF